MDTLYNNESIHLETSVSICLRAPTFITFTLHALDSGSSPVNTRESRQSMCNCVHDIHSESFSRLVAPDTSQYTPDMNREASQGSPTSRQREIKTRPRRDPPTTSHIPPSRTASKTT